MKTLEVINHWFNDNASVEIVLLRPLDSSRKLQNDLFWYSGKNCPGWSAGKQLTDEEVLATRCYKQRKFKSIEQDIPDDCAGSPL